MNRKKSVQLWVYGSIGLAFLLWYVAFMWKPFNFWLTMSFNTVLLSCISLYAGGNPMRRDEFNLRNIGIGIGSAMILYMIFWIGNQMLIQLSTYAPILFPDRANNLDAIYANRGTLHPFLVAALLFFPIGFGEELFWRGFVQRYFTRQWNGTVAFAVTTILYVLVHIITLNPVLIVAALTCGVFWGFLYMVTGSLVPVLISHMIWDPVIFVFLPVT